MVRYVAKRKKIFEKPLHPAIIQAFFMRSKVKEERVTDLIPSRLTLLDSFYHVPII